MECHTLSLPQKELSIRSHSKSWSAIECARVLLVSCLLSHVSELLADSDRMKIRFDPAEEPEEV
jgi:hypothetical protein